MFKTVLVGVDGRPNGRDAIALASQLSGPRTVTSESPAGERPAAKDSAYARSFVV